MKNLKYYIIWFVLLNYAHHDLTFAQSSSSAPYCYGAYSQTPCNQAGPSNSPGNFINDFIDDFSTTGGNTNISNIGSGCNTGQLVVGTTTTLVNYVNHCSHYLAVSPGQTIVCTMRSGIIFAQGFAMWVDWNQDNTFNVPGEYVGGTAGVPTAATNTTITFVIPSSQPNGTYRMRVRCTYFTAGSGISPCGAFTFGETEDYTLFVGPVPPNSATPTGTAVVNSPVCAGQALNFSLTTTYTSALSYTWTGPGGFSSTLQNPTIANASPTNSGVYSVLVSNSLCPIVRTVSASVIAYPDFTVTPATHTICQGGTFNVTASMTANPLLYSYNWTSANLWAGNIMNSTTQTAFIQPVLLPITVPVATIVYSVTVSPTAFSCPLTKSMTLTINNPLTPTLTMPAPLCDSFSPVQLNAVPGGGTWSANPAVSASGQFSPALASIGTNTVKYSVSAGQCNVSNSATLAVSKFHTPALSSSITSRCVQDPPFNLMNIVQDTTMGLWTGIGVSNNFFIASSLSTGNYSLTYHTKSLPDTSVCPATTVLVVPVFNPPTPTITGIPPLCDNAATVALSANPPGGVWSGNPGVSNLGIRTPSLNLVGLNTVTYTAGQGTCVASSSRTFHLSQFNTASFSGTIANLCANSNPVNLMGIVQNTNGSWAGVNVSTGGYFNPGGLPTNTYQLVYSTTSTPNPYLCPDSKSITVSVLNPVTPNITPIGPLCNVGAPVQLSVTPNTGMWVTTSFLNSSGVFTPSSSAVGDNPVQYVIGTATCNSKQTIIVKTEAFVSAAITGSIPDLCVTSTPLNLSPYVANSTGTWAGPGMLGSVFNPSLTSAGTFNVSYNTASIPSGLCPDQSLVAVHVYSLAPPDIKAEGPFCNTSLPIQLQVSPVGGLFGSGTSGLVSNSGIFNPAMGIIGSNYVSYTISVGPCIAHSRIQIAIEKFISADFENIAALTYCKNNLPFNLNSLVQNPGGNWSSTNSAALNEYMFDPSKANIGSNIIIYQTHSTPSTLLCPDTKSINIEVKDVKSIAASATATQGCAPLEVVFNTANTNTGKGIWTISDGWTAEGLSVSRVFTSPGTYSVLLNYVEEDAVACSTQVNLYAPITVYETPKADFTMNKEVISISDPVLELTNQSSPLNDNKYEWSVSGNLSSTELHPIFTLDKIGTYKVMLLASSMHDCKSEAIKFVEVKNEFKVYIPNSFTPNFDGLNDVFIPVFSPYGLDSKSFEMNVYDRWGHVVFSSKDSTKGWDGTFKNSGDQIMKKDSYIYSIRFKDLQGKVYEEKGAVTMIPN